MNKVIPPTDFLKFAKDFDLPIPKKDIQEILRKKVIRGGKEIGFMSFCELLNECFFKKKINDEILCLLNNDVEVTENWTDNILKQFDSFKEKIPVLLDQSFNKYSGISNKDRNRIIASVNEVVRFRGLLDYVIEKGSKRKIQHVNPKLRNGFKAGIVRALI